jgi:hypothetical protein
MNDRTIPIDLRTRWLTASPRRDSLLPGTYSAKRLSLWTKKIVLKRLA